MLRRLLIVAWFISLLGLAAGVSGAEPAGYYASATGLRGSALRAALHQRIRAHTVVSYSNATNALRVLDEDPANPANVILIYSRVSRSKTAFGSEVGDWNREHTWPDSYGINGSGPEYSDLFHLRPADMQVNSTRGNLFFDESTTGTGYVKPAHANTPLCSRDVDSWEPPTAVKGDIARGLFYMDVRYAGTNGEPDLALTNDPAEISESGFKMGLLNTLLVWHFLDPVDDAERARNDRIYSSYQNNRNPFIDRPEFVEALYGPVVVLQAARSGTQLQISWPALVPETMRVLETSQNLRSWSTTSPSTTVSGSWRGATFTFAGGRRFFRLKLKERDG